MAGKRHTSNGDLMKVFCCSGAELSALKRAVKIQLQQEDENGQCLLGQNLREFDPSGDLRSAVWHNVSRRNSKLGCILKGDNWKEKPADYEHLAKLAKAFIVTDFNHRARWPLKRKNAAILDLEGRGKTGSVAESSEHEQEPARKKLKAGPASEELEDDVDELTVDEHGRIPLVPDPQHTHNALTFETSRLSTDPCGSATHHDPSLPGHPTAAASESGTIKPSLADMVQVLVGKNVNERVAVIEKRMESRLQEEKVKWKAEVMEEILRGFG